MKAAGLGPCRSDLRTEVTVSSVIVLGCQQSSGYTVEHDKYLLVDCLNQQPQRGGIPGWSKGNSEIMGSE